MICPDCGHANIRGVDLCAECGQDLTSLDRPGMRNELEESLLEQPVQRLDPGTPVIVAPTTKLREAWKIMADEHVGCLMVGTADDLQGVFSERDVLLRVGDRYLELADTPVSEFMSSDPETIEADHPIAFALNRMEVGDFRHIPVMRQGKLTGMVSIRFMLALLADWYPDLFEAEKKA